MSFILGGKGNVLLAAGSVFVLRPFAKVAILT
jgi:hypothetical protein